MSDFLQGVDLGLQAGQFKKRLALQEEIFQQERELERRKLALKQEEEDLAMASHGLDPDQERFRRSAAETAAGLPEGISPADAGMSQAGQAAAAASNPLAQRMATIQEAQARDIRSQANLRKAQADWYRANRPRAGGKSSGRDYTLEQIDKELKPYQDALTKGQSLSDDAQSDYKALLAKRRQIQGLPTPTGQTPSPSLLRLLGRKALGVISGLPERMAGRGSKTIRVRAPGAQPKEVDDTSENRKLARERNYEIIE